MSVRRMNGRQFKKLCSKAYSIIAEIPHVHLADAYCPKNADQTDFWHHTVLKGTKGFGGMSGYFEPEWSDESAYKALDEIVYWHFCHVDETNPLSYWPENLPDLSEWRNVIILGKRLVAEKNNRKGGAA